jgi:hypothetical protein
MSSPKEDAPGCTQERRLRLPGLIQRLGGAKSRALRTAEHIRDGVRIQDCHLVGAFGLPLSVAAIRDRCREVEDCSTWLRVRDYHELGEYHMETRRCRHHLICPPCAIYRGLNHVRKIMERFEIVRRQCSGRMFPYLLTLGVKTGPDLRERYRHMSRSWRSLMSDRLPGHGRPGNELSRLMGGVYSFEAKIGKGCEDTGERLWNAHMHALVFSAEHLPVVSGVGRDGKARHYWPELSEQWRAKTGDSFIVECHPVRERTDDPAADIASMVADESDGLLSAVCEVSKYAVKLSDGGPGDVVESWAALRGCRLCGSFGAFYGVDVAKEDESCDMRALAAFVEYVYRFDRKANGYSVEHYRIDPGVPAESVVDVERDLCPKARAILENAGRRSA